MRKYLSEEEVLRLLMTTVPMYCIVERKKQSAMRYYIVGYETVSPFESYYKLSHCNERNQKVAMTLNCQLAKPYRLIKNPKSEIQNPKSNGSEL